MTLQPISFKNNITIENIPLQWLSKIELYYPELPNFPTVYIHKKVEDVRIYGFPCAISSTNVNETGLADITFIVLTNVNLEESQELKEIITEELKERIGASDKISHDDIIATCNGNTEYEQFFNKLWEPIESVYGKYIPYGKFYEEIYSIVRFVSAFDPKTGRQSEMRMLYNFMSIFGEKILINIDEWSFCDFFIIPNYIDIKNRDINEFDIFSNLFNAMEKIYNLSFTGSFYIEDENGEDVGIQSQEKSFPKKKEVFISTVLDPLKNQGLLSNDEQFYIERLVDAFNRYPWRAAFFISSIFMIYTKDYNSWEKDFFIKFYEKAGIGISQKVVACFIQQGFKNPNVIPIDTWIESFFRGALSIESNNDFFNAFSSMGKLERIIWLSSQANKTNIINFFNTLWCCRYGTNGNTTLRGANPLSCYECSLRKVCKGYSDIKNKNIFIYEGNLDDIRSDTSNASFICLTKNSVPKKIYKKQIKRHNINWILVDEFSGYLLSNNITTFNNVMETVENLLNNINPPYNTDEVNLLQNS